MAVPAWIWFVEPVLLQLSQANEAVSRRSLVAEAVERMCLSSEDLAEMAGSTRYTKAEHRAAWALSYASMSGLAESPRRGHWRLTSKGRALLAAHPVGIPESDLQKIARRRKDASGDPDDILAPTRDSGGEAVEATPEERLRQAHVEIRESVRAELLGILRSVPPARFEGIVLEVLFAMGYGGTRSQLRKTAAGADGGIDGIIPLDKLGLDKVYVQAKRYAEDKAVSRPAIQGFLGALSERRATKGVFITTSRFTDEARESATRSSDSLVLIDGDMLAELMIDHGVGVSTRETFAIVQTDSDYFEER
jgi:restriction system protein